MEVTTGVHRISDSFNTPNISKPLDHEHEHDEHHQHDHGDPVALGAKHNLQHRHDELTHTPGISLTHTTGTGIETREPL